MTSLDFFSLLVLICPNFPKSFFNKINIIYQLIYNQNNSAITLCMALENPILPFEFFVVFSLSFFYSEFFSILEKIYKQENFWTDIQKNLNLTPVEIKDISKDSGLINLIKEETILEILISCNEKMLNEYSLNLITFVEEAKEMIEKYSVGNNILYNTKKKSEINSLQQANNGNLITFIKFHDRCLKNYNFIYDFFTNLDEYSYEVDIQNFLLD